MKIEQLALVQAWAEAGHLFSERERAALAWAETVTRVSETGVPDAAFQAARAAFEEKELVDLTIAISLMNAYNPRAQEWRARRPVDRQHPDKNWFLALPPRHDDVSYAASRTQPNFAIGRAFP
jgi:hypothetical protein